jgi:hypothetical protein
MRLSYKHRTVPKYRLFFLCAYSHIKSTWQKKCHRLNNTFIEEILQTKTWAWFQQVPEISRFGNVIVQPRYAPTLPTFYQPPKRKREA